MTDQDILGWKNLPKNMNNKLHSLCSYMAMFPPSVPNFFIKKYSNENDVVLDPFSGRGTTVLEACLLNRKAIGNDKNKLAYILTKAKSDVPQKGRILSRISKLETEFRPDNINIDNVESDIRMIFSDFTIKQLVYLRAKLNWKTSNVDAFITAMILGVLHGNSELYLSLSMPNTFSMSSNYIKNYISRNKLTRPERNAFDSLRKKLERCYQRPISKGTALNKDARTMTKVKRSSVDLIVTSPPYMKVIRYGQFNWIRLWFLNEKGNETDKRLFITESMIRYKLFMSETLNEMKRVLKPKGRAVLVLGDVKSRESGKINNLAEIVYRECAAPLGFRLVEPIIEDVISDENKVSKIWGEKKGNATKIDRVLVLSL